MTYAETKRAYRARAKAAGKLPSAFETGRFVAVDGEGFSDGETISLTIGENDKPYEAADHFYGLLMDSDGNEEWTPSGRLSAKQCLDFLLAISERDKHAIPVIFGGSYDVCHMLAFGGFERDDILQLLRGADLSGRRYLDATLSDGETTHDYRIEYRSRKSLTVWRFEAGAAKYRQHVRRDGGREWKLNPEARVCLWDVWGFFQGSFVAAMENWLPDDPDWFFIRDMKGQRSVFERSEIEAIRRYTAAELRCLVAMMERVRASVRSLNLTISRWDGAGAIAAAMFRANDVKAHMAVCPPEVFNAARIAYAGGHIEAMKLGYHKGKVWHYDINSAYPHQFRRLPGLAAGEWRAGDGVPPSGFTLVQLEYHYQAGLPFYPLFHRSENGSIRYPERGVGWYWFDEYECAREFAERFGVYEFRVIAWHHFETRANAAPFGWIEDAYQVRREVIMRARETGVRDDSHMMIRLGLNSCYGKTAQQVGARHDRDTGEIVPPAYFQLEWAGFVTSGCRAQLMRAAMQKPDAVISFATDAIFTTEALDLPSDPAKRLGEWERHEHERGMTIVMPGVYWLHDHDKIRHFSRGFDKAALSEPEIVHAAWRRGETTLHVEQRRMVTLGSATMSENFWKLRGLFVTTTRELKINGFNSKRHPVAMTQCAPHKGLVNTWPRDHDAAAGIDLASLMSAPYPIAWIDGADEPDDEPFSAFVLDRDAFDSVFLA